MTVKWDVDAVVHRVKVKVTKGVENVAEWIRKDAVRRIEEKPKHGRLYIGPPFRIGKPPHRASAPGEAPADDTGALKASGHVEVDVGLSGNRVGASVAFGGSGADYARELEYGDPSREFPIAPRPFLRPATLEARKHVKRIIEAELAK